MTAARTSVITDWRTKDEDLPDIAPGAEYERVIVTQKFVVLHRIVTRGPSLIRLQLPVKTFGRDLDPVRLPFELENVDGNIHTYKLKINSETLHAIKTYATPAAAAIGPHALALLPAVEICLALRNEGDAPTKPRAALVVQEEV
ncbi:MAG TPA: hypothetical protein VLE97_06365 [Gaiellaceae bacterium]|nr:hypothetical protein [Gaiellaceae bacterium]